MGHLGERLAVHTVIGREIQRAVDIGEVLRAGTTRPDDNVFHQHGARGGAVGLPEFRAVVFVLSFGLSLVVGLVYRETHRGVSYSQSYVHTMVIMGVVVINAIIGFVQEGKAEHALKAIRKMLSPRATIMRQGRQQLMRAPPAPWSDRRTRCRRRSRRPRPDSRCWAR